MPLALIRALRPHQWVKNLLVFAPLLFAHRLGDTAALLHTLSAFACYCLAASSIYLVNDLIDREQDRNHPTKRRRPIASGALPVPVAVGAVPAVLAVATVLALSVPQGAQDVPFVVWPVAYLVLNVAYSLRLKRVVILDCMCIAAGFQLRVHAGAAAIDVEPSSWILLCTFFFALLLAFCKRFEELGRQAAATGETRTTMRDYTAQFLSIMIGPLAALSILTYALYTVSPETVATHHTRHLMYTVPVVAYGVFRYLFLVYRRDEGGDPARLLFRDPPLLISGAAYLATVWLVLR